MKIDLLNWHLIPVLKFIAMIGYFFMLTWFLLMQMPVEIKSLCR